MAICKALVVEHDVKTRETIEEILTTLDCEYEFADSLSQARKMLGRTEYGLVLPACDMPWRTGAVPRAQNSEHFMLLLRRAREKNMPKVVMLMPQRSSANHEDIARWAFGMRDLGVTDVILKPLVDEGRTLDRVIQKVMSLNKDAHHCQQAGAAPAPGVTGGAADVSAWLTVTDAAKLLMHDLLGLGIRTARSRISTAAGRNEFRFAGVRKQRRIEPNSFDSWRLKQRDRDLDEEDGDEAA